MIDHPLILSFLASGTAYYALGIFVWVRNMRRNEEEFRQK